MSKISKAKAAPATAAPPVPAAPVPAAPAANPDDTVAVKARAFDAALTELEDARTGATTAQAVFDGLAENATDDARHEALFALGEAETRLLLAADAMDALAADNALKPVEPSPVSPAPQDGVELSQSADKPVEPVSEEAPATSTPDTTPSERPEDESPEELDQGGGGDPAAPAVEKDYLTRAIEGAIAEARSIQERDGADSARQFLATLRDQARETIAFGKAFDTAVAGVQLSLGRTVQVWAVGDVLFGGEWFSPGSGFWVDPTTRDQLGGVVSTTPPETATPIENEGEPAQLS